IGFVPAEDGIKVVYQQSYNSQLVVYVAQLDADARLIKNPQAVDSVRTNWWATQERQFYFSSSTDNGYLIIYGLGSAKDDQLRLRTTLLNAALTPVAQREQLFDFKARPQFGQAALANDGTFYFCLFPGKELHFNGAKAWLYSLDADASKLHEIRIPRTDFFLSSPLIKLDQNQQQVYFCGSYSEKRS